MSGPLSFADAVSTLTLDKMKVGQMTAVSNAVLQDAKVEVVAEMMSDQLVARLTGWMLADKLAPATHDVAVSFDHYASAWQHAKAEWFPTFSRWLRRPGVKVTTRQTVTVQVDSWATFPEHNRAYPPELGRVVRFQQVTDRLSWASEDDDPQVSR